MHIIYKITYLPHLEAKTPPYYYIGSKFNYDGKYMGSPSSNQIDWYTDEKPIKEWWKFEISNSPEKFLFEILEIVDTESPNLLVEIERNYHITFDVRDSLDYFNKAVATNGWVSAPRTEYTKQLLSEKTTRYWNSSAGQEKKKRLSERNKSTQSEKMKQRWSNPTDSMKTRICHGRPKGAKDLIPRKPKLERKVYIDGVVYETAKLAAQKLNLHPVSVRRKCKSPMFTEWRYIE